ncbi:hypothetical protein DFQ29_008830 [Apophysomyces sp. BC1021]|nr:hypothetical protein DFQ29_008830 [Apophysomyces sp. BC1021]
MEPHYGLQRPPPAFMVRPPQPVLEYDQAMLTKRYDALRDALVQHGNEQPKVLDDFRLLLQHIMRECSRANIEHAQTVAVDEGNHTATIGTIVAVGLPKRWT